MLRGAGVLAPERIRGVETGACPHTAIRDDITANLLAIEDLEADFDPVDLVLVESGGDNLTATFSPALVDAQIFVLDVAGGGDVVRKGGPGIARADLLVVNKTDLAPYVGVDAELMVRQGAEARDGRPVLGLSRTDPDSVDRLLAWVEARLARLPGRDAGAAGPRPDGGARPRSPRHPHAVPPWTEPAACEPHPVSRCAATRPEAESVSWCAPTARAGAVTSAFASSTPGTDPARVAVLAEGALLVAGDDVSVGMRVGPGRAAGRRRAGRDGGLRHAGRIGSLGRRPSRSTTAARWSGGPSRSSSRRVRSSTARLSVVLDGSGAALLREVLVLGRVREAGGVVRQRLRASARWSAAARRGPRSRRRAASRRRRRSATGWSTR